MKITIYYILLLIGVSLITGYGLSNQTGSMTMPQALGISSAMVLYTVALCFVGEGKLADEREQSHRYISNRVALVVSSCIISLGVILTLFVSHRIDYWLLSALVALNLSKLVSLIYLNYKK